MLASRMVASAFAAWCNAVVAAGDDVDAIPVRPCAVVTADDAAALVVALAAQIEWLREGARYDYSAGLAALLDTLLEVRKRQQSWLRRHEATLVGALTQWIDSAEHGDDCLVGLVQLDTAGSLGAAIEHVADQFTRRETAGHARVVDAVERKTAHAAALFPRLLHPIETQQQKLLLWDRWHVSTGAAIADLANELHRAGRLTPHPLAPVTPEIEMLLAGGDRCCTPLAADERRTFTTALRAMRSNE